MSEPRDPRVDGMRADIAAVPQIRYLAVGASGLGALLEDREGRQRLALGWPPGWPTAHVLVATSEGAIGLEDWHGPAWDWLPSEWIAA